MRIKFLTLLFSLLLTTSLYAEDHLSHAPEDAWLYFIEPADGATVSGSFSVKFGLSGMGVAPAGVEKTHTGHHHLLINVDSVDLTKPLPSSDQYRHFGGGQTETELMLEPGTYTLQLVLGNHMHIPHYPPVISDKITVTVK